MKIRSIIIVCLAIFISCAEKEIDSKTKLLASFGDQPSVTIGNENEIFVVFGKEASIYLSRSEDDGESFSEPTKIAELEDLYLGYSSGPRIAITKEYTVVTAMNKDGNYFAWSKSNSEDKWSGPTKINDVDGSAAEVLGDLTATPDGKYFAVWIDTRVLESEMHAKPEKKRKPIPREPRTEEDLDKMTPKGITVRELFEDNSDVPKNSHLSFFGDEEDNILWVFFDEEGNVLKAENIDEYRKFKERNEGKVKPKGKIYLSSSEDGGQSWSISQMVYRSPEGSVCECCKPSITSDVNGDLTVMFRNNVGGSRDLHFTKSTDGGISFSEPVKLGTGTWKINGCPMDGGDLCISSTGLLTTVWQRNGEIFLASSGNDERFVGRGRSPSITYYNGEAYKVYVAEKDIMFSKPDSENAYKIGVGSSPRLISTDSGVVCFWVSKAGIRYKKV